MQIRKALPGVAGVMLVLGSALAPQAANAASLDNQLRSSIERLLTNMKEGAVSQMTKDEQLELADCVYEIMADIPSDRKEYIVKASGFEELRARFDEVGLENQAAVKKKIQQSCA
jgi:hypothetical protein